MSIITEVEEQISQIPKRQIKRLIKDPVKTAEAVNLIYVNDNDLGIRRVRKGTTFEYFIDDKKIVDEDELLRIKKLVIPPAWENVRICSNVNGHLQVTGIDVRGRKQYKYHPAWNILRNHTKFYRLHDFGKCLPAMRLRLEKDLALPELPLQKVLATVVSLMERTSIRIGNESYEKIYGSYGLTTMKDKHVKIKGTSIKFKFKGKKGVEHDIDIKSKRLAGIVKKCQDIPGKELFQYYDEEKNKRSIDSGMVNDYIKEISGGDFTAKDFRTWTGTVQALVALKEMGFETQTEAKKNIVSALDSVSSALGNTRTVCKKYYVHPIVLSLYETKTLEKHLTQLDEIEKNDNKSDLTTEEKILMNILKSN
jgi:DNA topoisomerase-1